MSESIVPRPETDEERFVKVLDQIIAVLNAVRDPYPRGLGSISAEDRVAFALALNSRLQEINHLFGEINSHPLKFSKQVDIGRLFGNLYWAARKPHLTQLYVAAVTRELRDIRHDVAFWDHQIVEEDLGS